jgi:uncharacterized protein (DUF488 family)
MTLFTIGYGGRKPSDFVDCLLAAGVRTVVDVRLRPNNAAMGAYVKAKSAETGIEHLLARAGIGYRSLIELGNVFFDCPDWQLKYAELLERAGDLLVGRLAGLPQPMCLLCAEKNPAECHRTQIAESLARRRFEVKHLL